MVISFRHKGLKRFFQTGNTSGIAPKHAARLRLLLTLLHAATVVDDMNLPGSGFHPLKGKQKDRYAVKVSGNWRLTFKFDEAEASEVDYEDYH